MIVFCKEPLKLLCHNLQVIRHKIVQRNLLQNLTDTIINSGGRPRRTVSTGSRRDTVWSRATFTAVL